MTLPFFIYGTLLPKQPNFYLLQNALSSIDDAILPGATLYDTGGAPMLLQASGGEVQGALVTVADAQYQQTLASLDRLEVYFEDAPDASLYLRERCRVTRSDGEQVEAWVYVGKPHHVKGLEPFGGNWLSYSAEHRADIEAWWQNYNSNSNSK